MFFIFALFTLMRYIMKKITIRFSLFDWFFIVPDFVKVAYEDGHNHNEIVLIVE